VLGRLQTQRKKLRCSTENLFKKLTTPSCCWSRHQTRSVCHHQVAFIQVKPRRQEDEVTKC